MPAKRKSSKSDEDALLEAIINPDEKRPSLDEVIQQNLKEHAAGKLPKTDEEIRALSDIDWEALFQGTNFKPGPSNDSSENRIEIDWLPFSEDHDYEANVRLRRAQSFVIFISNALVRQTAKVLESFGNLEDTKILEQEIEALTEKYLREQAKELFTRAALFFDDPEKLREFLDEVSSDYLPAAESSPNLPNAAPELYKERENRKEKPEQFLERVYGSWLNGSGLFRSHIKAWDLSLYQNLYKRRKQIPDFETLLPTSKGRSADELARSDAELVAARRASVKKSKAKAKQPANKL